MNIQFSSRRKPSSPRALAIGGLIFLIVSIGFLIAGGVIALNIDRFVRDAAQTTGTVVALSEQHNTDRQSTTYAPVFTFTTETGKTQSVTSSVGTDPASFTVGDRIPVLYRRSDPSDAQIDSFWQLWFLPIFLAGFSLAEFLAGTILLYLARRKHRKQAASASLG